MSAILHISDTHFGREVPAVESALIELHRALGPELVVLSGDVTQRARVSEFAKASAFLARLEPRALLAVPGNHDLPLLEPWVRFRDPYGRFRQTFGEDLEPSFESEQLLVIGVNTTRPRRLEDGEISAAQVERVALRLWRARKSQLAVVVTHQPLHGLLGRAARFGQRSLVSGDEAAVNVWTRAGANLFLAGHIHMASIESSNQRYPEVPRSSWAIQAGTAVSGRLRGFGPNSVNLIRFEPDAERCAIERWNFDPGSSRFALAARTFLPYSNGSNENSTAATARMPSGATE